MDRVVTGWRQARGLRLLALVLLLVLPLAPTSTVGVATASVPAQLPAPLLSESFDGVTQGVATNLQFDLDDRVAGTGAGAFGRGALPSYVVESSTPGLSSITLDLWFKPAANVRCSLPAAQGLAGFSGSTAPDATAGTWDKDLYLDTDGTLVWYVYPGAPSLVRSKTRAWRADRWYHVTASVGTGGQKLYVDGVLEASSSASTSFSGTPYYLTIGRAPTAAGSKTQFFGKIDELRVYPGVHLPQPAVSPAPTSNLVLNGDMEQPTVCGNFTPFLSGASINGWQVQTDNVEVVGRYWAAASGDQSLDLAGGAFPSGTAGAIYQDLPTVAGKSYRLRLRWLGTRRVRPRSRPPRSGGATRGSIN